MVKGSEGLVERLNGFSQPYGPQRSDGRSRLTNPSRREPDW